MVSHSPCSSQRQSEADGGGRVEDKVRHRQGEGERENIDIRCSRAVTAINIHTIT